MPRRRRSPLRGLFTLIALGGVSAAGAAGGVAIYDHLTKPPVVLSTPADRDPTPPAESVPGWVERKAPAQLRFDDVGVDEQIRPVGLQADGELQVPGADEIGWWHLGSAPGFPGATVLAAHVSWNGSIGPFNRLGDAEIGERLEIETAEGATRTYQVVERAMYRKDELPADRIWRTAGSETLVLITCGGDFNPDIRRYRHNIVVYATPVANPSEPA